MRARRRTPLALALTLPFAVVGLGACARDWSFLDGAASPGDASNLEDAADAEDEQGASRPARGRAAGS